MNATDFYKTISAMGKLEIRRREAAGESMHQAPLGYKNIRIDGRSVIVKDSKKYRLVQYAKTLRAEGKSIKAICRIMKHRGLRSRRGKVIGPSSMHLIVRREGHTWR